MPPKCPIGGSGDAGAAKAPEHGMEMETEVAVTTGELSLHPDVVDGVELPQPEAEFHTDSGATPGTTLTTTPATTPTTTPAMTPTTTTATTPTTTDSWLVIYTHLCVK